MRSDTLLDYAVLQLSPKRSRCELLVSSDGFTEKLASGSVKPYLDHLKVAEEQAAHSVQSIRLEVDRHRNAETWFTKGTFERFVRYVGMPEVLEMVNTFDAEMSQLEAARKIYSQGAGDQRMDSQGGDGTRVIGAADATTKELLRAIDVRLSAVRQDLTTAYATASASGFNPYTVSQLKHFAHQFRAHRLNEACTKYSSVYERRPELITQQDEKPRGNDTELRSSINSDMSIDNEDDEAQAQTQAQDQTKTSTWQPPKTFATFTSLQRNNDNSVIINKNKDEAKDNNTNNDGTSSNKEQTESSPTPLPSSPTPAPGGRRLSVQDRINLFEKKQKENTGKPVELRRMSSDVFRRWSGSSDMSIDVSMEKKSSIESSMDNNHNNNLDKVVKNDQRSSSEERSDVGFKDHHQVKGSSDRYEFVVDGNDKDDDDGGGDVKFDGGVKSNNVVATSLGRVHSSHSRSFSAQFESSGGGVGFKSREASNSSSSSSVVLNGVDQSTTQPHLRSSFALEAEGFKNQVKEEDSQVAMKTKYQKPVPASSEQTVVSRGKRDEIRGGNESTKMNLSGKKQILESQDNGRVTVPLEQNQRVRQSKGNQEMHDELKLKADELEKLFAEHKLRVPGDQANSARRIESVDARVEQAVNSQSRRPGIGDSTQQPADVRVEQSVNSQSRRPGVGDSTHQPADTRVEHGVNSKSRRPGVGDSTPQLADARVEQAVNLQSGRPGVGDSTPQPFSRSSVPEPAASSGAKSLTKMVDSQNYGDVARQNLSELNFGDESRGKFYEKYMKKRNAKLQEEWSLNRSEKEARMKAMQDSLERSRAEMKSKFSSSIIRQNSAGGSQRAEKLGYFKSNIKRDQHPIDSLQNEEDEDLSEFSEEKIYGASKQIRKNFPNRNVSSGTPRTTVMSMPRSSGKRRDNPLAMSVPNFSDLRKENTKPSSGVSKPTRSQVRNYARSRSTNEEEQSIKEEKLRQSLSLRKSSANPAEFKDLSSLNSDGIVLTPLKFDLDETDPDPYDQSSRSFLKKGNTAGPGFVGSAIRMKASMTPDTEKEFNDLEFDMEDSFHTATGEQDEIGSMAIEDSAFNHNNGKVSLSQESVNSGSEIGDSTRSLAQADPILGGEMPNAFPSTFNGVGSRQDSPVESPVSWNSRAPHPFSYPHESSDIDASIDSPIGSPAWNPSSLMQGENDAARMRKKWGSAQKPYLVANSSQNQPRKDVAKGFKRLLKFGRKTRGTETLADWVSVTTSEGDDDMEDGRDLANRSSEDLRKSRMGLSHGHPSDESFNENELFNEHVQSLQSSIPAPPAHFKLRDDHISGSSLKAPKSFFSLSTFRSKGSDSKPR